MHNGLGQKIEIGSRVLLVTQGQGFANINLGMVDKFSKDNFPIVKYAVRDGKVGDYRLTPPIIRYERLFVITEQQFDELVEVAVIKSEFDKNYRWVDAAHGIQKGPPWRWQEAEQEIYMETLNAAMKAAGKDEYYG